MFNGDVEAYITCGDEELDTFIKILKKGSLKSHVTHIIKEESTTTFNKGFTIKN